MKHKRFICLALVFIGAFSVFAVMHFINAQTAPILSIVPTGDSGATSITDIPVQAVGATFSVDVRLDDYAAVTEGGPSPGVNACTYMVTWNPAVLSFTTKTDGKWIPNQSSIDITSDTGSGELIVNQIDLSSYATADSSSGSVTATVEFTVLSTG